MVATLEGRGAKPELEILYPKKERLSTATMYLLSFCDHTVFL